MRAKTWGQTGRSPGENLENLGTGKPENLDRKPGKTWGQTGRSPFFSPKSGIPVPKMFITVTRATAIRVGSVTLNAWAGSHASLPSMFRIRRQKPGGKTWRGPKPNLGENLGGKPGDRRDVPGFFAQIGNPGSKKCS
jgi:hypothetical protein